tara:strand:+ start:182 stop:526 length:345 start_codon:yes stop_codon:yes gene_type:complete
VDLDIHGYDFIIDNGSALYKVQVKGTTKKQKKRQNCYKISCGKGNKNKTKYKEDAFDYLVVVIYENEEHFYVIPRSEINSITMNFYPNETELQNPHKSGKWEKYKDYNLKLLKG